MISEKNQCFPFLDFQPKVRCFLMHVPSSSSKAFNEVVDAAFWETGAKAAAEAMREARMSFMVEMIQQIL
jgi:hypothetical protein